MRLSNHHWYYHPCFWSMVVLSFRVIYFHWLVNQCEIVPGGHIASSCRARMGDKARKGSAFVYTCPAQKSLVCVYASLLTHWAHTVSGLKSLLNPSCVLHELVRA